MKKILLTSVVVFFSLTLLVGIIYPLIVWGIGNLFFRNQAQGSFILNHGKMIGSGLIAQSFTEPQYFHPRPSAVDYDANASGGSNLAPSNRLLVKAVRQQIGEMKRENPAPIPLDLVMSSASGLDPDISVAAALWQVSRIARARGIEEPALMDIINRYTKKPFLGFIGETRVNVLLLNIALDNNFKKDIK